MIKRFTFFGLALVLPLASAQAQMGGGNPAEEIKEIARMIDEQLKEIDKLLLESGKKGQTRKKPRELLQQAAEGSLTVQDGIEKLIEKLNEMKQKGQSKNSQGNSSEQDKADQQGSSGQQSDQQNQDNQQQSGGTQQRRENQTPDFVQQPNEGQKPGEQGKPEGKDQQGNDQKGKDGQQPQQANGNPKGGKDARAGGKNQLGNKPPENATGPGAPGTGEGSWGELQPYLIFLKNRGSTPKVPAKFRKYYDAYLKNKSKGSKK